MSLPWWGRMAPTFAGYLASEYLCDLCFICDGVRLPAHRLVLAQLGPARPDSLVSQILEDSEDCSITLEGWRPEVISRLLSDLYSSGMCHLLSRIFHII